jgi:hypothetical protein
MSSRRPWLQSPGVILFAYILLTLILTHPLLFNLTTAVPNDIGDPLLNTWILAWVSHALLTNPLHLFQANIFYPLANTLAYSEHLFSPALLALPIQLSSAEPVLAYNLSLLVTFPLAAFGMYLLTLHWTRHRSAAFVAGLVFAFNPYRFGAIAHLQLLSFQWLPFVLLYLDKILSSAGHRRSPQVSHYLGLTIFLTLQLLASWYLAVYTILTLTIYLFVALLAGQLRNITKPRSQVSLLIATLLFSFILTLPFIWPYTTLIEELRQARPLSLALSLAAAPADFLAAAPFNQLLGPLTASLRARPGFTEENTLFIGLVAPVLTVITLIRFTIYDSQFLGFASRRPASFPRRAFLALFTILLLCTSLTFAMPYATLAHLIPPSTIIRVPPRWIIPAQLALAGLAASGYHMLHTFLTRPKKAGRVPSEHSTPQRPSKSLTSNFLFLILVFLLLAETYSVPVPLAPVENRATLNPAYHWLAAQNGPMALVELPLHSAPAPEYPEVKRLYASTLGWWKLVNGYSGYTPPRQPVLAQALADFPGPRAITALQNLAGPATPPFFLLVHPGEIPFDRTRWETTERWQAERNPALWPIGSFQGDYLYHLLPPNSARFAASPLVRFGQNQNIQLLAYQLPAPNYQLPTTNYQLALYWRTSAPLSTGYTVFIHFRAADGFVQNQADGPPVSGHYPTTAWQPGEIIQDLHPFPAAYLAQADHLAIGLYHPASGERLPAFAPDGQPLAENMVLIPLP